MLRAVLIVLAVTVATASGDEFVGGLLKSAAGGLLGAVKDKAHENLFGTENPIPPTVVPGQPNPGGPAQRVKKTDERCVICQFVVQRVKADLQMNGGMGGLPLGFGARAAQDSADGKISSAGPFATGNPGDKTDTTGTTTGNQGDTETLTAPTEEGETKEVFLQVEQLPSVLRSSAAQAMLGTAPKKVAAQYAPGGPMYKSARERHVDLYSFQPTQRRYAHMNDGPMASARRAQQRYVNQQMFSVVYQTMEELCASKMPPPYYGYCGILMKEYEKIASGLRWNDRPDTICMQLQFCDKSSYVQRGPHAVFRPW